MAKMKLPKLSKKLKLPGFVKDLATNKYVLYIVAFFALTNILASPRKHKTKAEPTHIIFGPTIIFLVSHG